MSTQEQQNWYYASAMGERLGPVAIGELSSLASEGVVGPKTLVWSQGYPDWIPAEMISDLLTRVRPPVPPAAASTPVAEALPSAPPQDLKPRKLPFVFPRVMGWVMGAGVIGAVTAGVLTITGNSPWPGLAVFAVGSGLGVIASLVAYRKELYQIDGSHVISRGGGLVSDQTTELEIRNITHVKLRLPWLRFRFFGVGDVIVETAGTSKPVVLRLIPEPEAVYAGLRERMRRKGYDLTQQQLLHEEKPALIGILGECLGILSGATVAVLFVLSAILSPEKDALPPGFAVILTGLLGPVVVGLLVFVVVRFLDFRRRTYRVYNDVVVYDEGFLTCHHAFIPYENIADSDTKRTLIDQILGLYDVQVSCQGSSKEIKFRRLRNGVALSAAIDQLVVRARQKQKPDARSQADAALLSQDRPRRAEPAAIPTGETWVGEFRMNTARTLVPLIFLFPLVPIWIAAMIQAGVRLMSTRYSVRPGSLQHSYRFLTVQEREFAYDKITGVMIRQNLWDRMFGTMTLRFWSIGSGKPLEFAHVHGSQLDLPALMRQVGIPAASPEPYEADASVGVLTWFRGRLLRYLPLLLLFAGGFVFAAMRIDPIIYYLLGLPVLVTIGAFIHAKLHYAHQHLRFHEHHLEAEQGIIAKRGYHVRYSNIKRTTVTRYPGGEDGDMEIFVAAEEEILPAIQKKQNLQASLKPVSFTAGFLPAARDKARLLDDILCGRVEPAPQAVAAAPLEVLLEARRSVGNPLLKLILLSILLFPLILLLPITIPATVIRVKRWRYRIEIARIVMSWGFLYRRETSILMDRVDSLQQSQGPLNKLFGNGDVKVMTAGTSRNPDLHLTDSPAYLEIYQTIRERSR